MPSATLLIAQSAGDDGLGEWVYAGIALAAALAVAFGARWAIRRLARREDTATATTQIMARLAFGVIVAIGLYVALRAIGLDLAPVLAGAGIAGIAVAFALQDIVANYISGVVIGFRNPFVPGDQIISGAHEGTVEELNLRHTVIRTYDGVRVLLPNGELLKSPLTNLTVNGHRRTDFAVGVGYDTDLDRARGLMVAAVAAVEGVDEQPAPQAWVEELAASSITIRVRYWHAPRIADTWQTRSAAIVAVVRTAREAEIELPFDRTVIELARQDGAAPER